MSENNIRAWRLSSLKPEECTDQELVRRLLENSYAHGFIGHKKGLDSKGAKRLEEVVKRDREALEKRLDEDLVRKEGVKEGIVRYAWWRDGVQYVGSCGRTLEKALQEVEEEFAPTTGQGAKE